MKNIVNDRSYVLQTNTKLFDATLEEFSSRDFDAASLNEILKRSGFNKGSFYYRFADKFELYAALLETMFARHAEILHDGSKTIIDIRGVETGLTSMVSSLYRLYQSDPRHLALYARLFDELAANRPSLSEILQTSPIERLIVTIIPLLAEGQPSIDTVKFFGNLARLTLYHLERVARIDGVWTDPGKVADSMIQSISRNDLPSGNPMFVLDHVDFGPTPDHPTHSTIDLVVSSGEIVALVGGRNAGKTTLRKLITGVLGPRSGEVRYLSPDLVKTGPDGIASLPSGIKLNRTVRWHLRQAGVKAGSERETGLLAELGLEEVADIRLDRLPDTVKIKTEFARLFAGDAKVLVIDDALWGLNPDERERICRMLLKRRHIGNTIILCSSRMEEALAIADRIAFLVAGTVTRVIATAELNRIYGQKSIVVDYMDGGLAHRTRFPLDSLSGPAFRDFILGNKILGIETRAVSGAEIFKMETGAELS